MLRVGVGTRTPDRTLDVLMLGWELPPAISGGLGTACDGLLHAMGGVPDLRTTFVLPSAKPVGGYAGNVRLLPLATAPKSTPSPATRKAGAYDVGVLSGASAYREAVSGALGQIGDFDVIHAHDWMTFDAALAVKEATGKRLVAHVHSIEQDRAGRGREHPSIAAIEQRGLDAADRIVAVSRYTRDAISRVYGRPASSIHVVHNGHRTMATDAQRTGEPPTRHEITFVGRLAEQKGPRYYIAAVNRVRAILPDARFVMAGDGHLSASLRSLARSFGLSDVLSFPGFIDRAAVQELLARSAVVVLPSLSEPFGLVALEAIHAGAPVILSEHAGLAEVVEHIVTVDPTDIAAIADAIIALMRDPDRCRALAEGARHDVAGLDWSRAVAALRSIYHDLAPTS